MEKGKSMNDSPLLEDEQNVYYDGLVRRIQSGDLQLIEVRNAPELAQTGTIIDNICHVPGTFIQTSSLLTQLLRHSK